MLWLLVIVLVISIFVTVALIQDEIKHKEQAEEDRELHKRIQEILSKDEK